MKKVFCIGCIMLTLLFATAMSVFAQEEEVKVKNANEDEVYKPVPMAEKGFKKENLFTGGNVTIGFGSNYAALGASPMVGYRINNYFDAGVVLGYLYQSVKGVHGDMAKQHTFGSGAFLRAYPVPMFFAQVQPEYNYTVTKYNSGDINMNGRGGAPSLLLGAGYAGGRTRGGTTFYYFSIMFDVLNRPRSPYSNIDRAMRPIINGGFNIGLFQKRYSPYEDRY